eukprot:s7606_g1.t1
MQRSGFQKKCLATGGVARAEDRHLPGKQPPGREVQSLFSIDLEDSKLVHFSGVLKYWHMLPCRRSKLPNCDGDARHIVLMRVDDSMETGQTTAEGYGKQRAKKGIRFVRFPPVLNLQLKRFSFDMELMDRVKLNSRFEFPQRLDLSEFAPGAGHFLLHSVVVHIGSADSGHYHTFIRPHLDKRWINFDDANVMACSHRTAVDDNFGGTLAK